MFCLLISLSLFFRHVLYAALELILLELIPEFQNEYPQYVETATAVSDNTEDGKKKV